MKERRRIWIARTRQSVPIQCGAAFQGGRIKTLFVYFIGSASWLCWRSLIVGLGGQSKRASRLLQVGAAKLFARECSIALDTIYGVSIFSVVRQSRRQYRV